MLGERDFPVPDYGQFESMSEVILSSSGKTAKSSYPPSKDGVSLEKARHNKSAQSCSFFLQVQILKQAYPMPCPWSSLQVPQATE